MFAVQMIKITEDTMFEFYFSKAMSEEMGEMKVNGIPYTERVVAGRKPINSARYPDLHIVFTGRQKDYSITPK